MYTHTEAEEYYKQVLKHTPDHANTLYNYAVMLDSKFYDRNRRAEAESFYRRAVGVEPRHAFALYVNMWIREYVWVWVRG